jgi:hypothetical protein
MVQLRIVKLPDRTPVGPLTDGQIFDFTTGTFTVEALPVAGAAKFEFALDGGTPHMESQAPFYALGDTTAWQPPPGKHRVAVRALNAAGQQIDSATVTVDAQHATIFVGTTQVDFDAMALPPAGEFGLRAGTMYVLKRPKPITCKLVRNGPGPNPIIRFDGAGAIDGSGALLSVKNHTAETENIDFIIGGGGIFHPTGNRPLMRFTNFTVGAPVKKFYGGYCGPLARDQGAGGYTEDNSAGIELINCSILAGVDKDNRDHVLRFVGFDNVKIVGGRYIHKIPDGQRDAYHAMFRAHQGGTLILGDETATTQTTLFQGLSVTFGPLIDGDGGINIGKPPKLDPHGTQLKDANGNLLFDLTAPTTPNAVPKRNFFDQAHLDKLRAFNVTFDTTDFRIWPGVLDFEFHNCVIRDRYAGAIVDTPFPYMSRQRSKGTFFNCTFEHIAMGPGGPPKLFSDDAGAQDMKCVNCTFAGNIFNKP